MSIVYRDPFAFSSQEEETCRCGQHDALARGPAPCARYETGAFCEIMYGYPQILLPENRELLSETVLSIETTFGTSLSPGLAAQSEDVIRNVPPERWAEPVVADVITNYLVVTNTTLLLLLDTEESIILDVNRDLLTNREAILDSIGNEEVSKVSERTTVGFGCMLVSVPEAEGSLAFNSGWYAKRVDKGWSCSWIQ